MTAIIVAAREDGRQAAAGAHGLHREEADHHREEERRDHQSAPAVEARRRPDRLGAPLPGLGAEAGGGDQVDRVDPGAFGQLQVGRLQGVGDVGDRQRRKADEQQRPGPSGAPAGEGDDADDSARAGRCLPSG